MQLFVINKLLRYESRKETLIVPEMGALYECKIKRKKNVKSKKKHDSLDCEL